MVHGVGRTKALGLTEPGWGAAGGNGRVWRGLGKAGVHGEARQETDCQGAGVEAGKWRELEESVSVWLESWVSVGPSGCYLGSGRQS